MRIYFDSIIQKIILDFFRITIFFRCKIIVDQTDRRASCHQYVLNSTPRINSLQIPHFPSVQYSKTVIKQRKTINFSWVELSRGVIDKIGRRLIMMLAALLFFLLTFILWIKHLHFLLFFHVLYCAVLYVLHVQCTDILHLFSLLFSFPLLHTKVTIKLKIEGHLTIWCCRGTIHLISLKYSVLCLTSHHIISFSLDMMWHDIIGT